MKIDRILVDTKVESTVESVILKRILSRLEK